MGRKTSTMPTPHNSLNTIVIVSTMASLEPKYFLALEVLPEKFLFLTTFIKITVSTCSSVNGDNFSSLDILTSLASCYYPFTIPGSTQFSQDSFLLLPSEWQATDALVSLLSRTG